ncbi:MAG: sugar ABC transporter substrate-binding protein [Treponema sp.]|jgi:ribose transport system substrate-binding protein|nr:sugar ABC transporter substrate-binding protein [Treponema sp.]
MKKVMTICFLALLAVLFAGCKRENKAMTFGYTCKQLSNPFFTILEQTIREEVEKKGGRLITVDSDMDPQKQISQIEDMIKQKIDALFLNPVDSETIRPALVSLNKANIPVINFDSEVRDIDMVAAYVGSDNYNAGYVCGLDMVKRLPNGGPIAVLDSPARLSSRNRIDGFHEAIEENGFTVVFLRDTRGDFSTAQRHIEDMFKSYPEVAAIMGVNDPTALGALAACQAANHTNILIYGIDGSPAAKAEIAKRGQFAGTGAQSPISIAKESAAVAYKILNKQPYEKRIPVSTFIINQENIDQYDINCWQ